VAQNSEDIEELVSQKLSLITEFMAQNSEDIEELVSQKLSLIKVLRS
jgi:hypothetical protein